MEIYNHFPLFFSAMSVSVAISPDRARSAIFTSLTPHFHSSCPSTLSYLKIRYSFVFFYCSIYAYNRIYFPRRFFFFFTLIPLHDIREKWLACENKWSSRVSYLNMSCTKVHSYWFSMCPQKKRRCVPFSVDRLLKQGVSLIWNSSS